MILFFVSKGLTFIMDNFHQNILDNAIRIINEEAQAIKQLAEYVDKDFAMAVDTIFASKGRVIVTGIGKSAIIGQKIVATFNSTGTPAVFMHAADAIHGDLGIVQADDTVICISKSGSTPEIKVLVPLLLDRGSKLIAMVSNVDSFLAKHAHYVLKAVIEREACPNNLAPTTSTTAQMVLGDALAVCLLEKRGFTRDDFAKVHPGGALGKQLYLRVSDLFKVNSRPQVFEDTSLNDTIYEISSKRLGATAVVNPEGKMVGFITDGDIRRMLQRGTILEGLTARQIMSPRPKTIKVDDMAISAFQMMEQYKITQLAVVDHDDYYIGMVHIHDILKEGIV